MARHVWDSEVGDCMMCGVVQTITNTKGKCHYKKKWAAFDKETTKMSYWKNGKEYTANGVEIVHNGGYTGSYQGNLVKSKCVGHDADPILDYKGMLVTGYKKSDLPLRGNKKTLVINLTGTSVGGIEWPVKKLPASLNLLDLKDEYGIDLGDEMLIDWPDRGAVAIRPKWWLDMLNATKTDGYENVNVCCFGGHGRTGTALACMLVAAKAVKSGDEAVDLVRKLHCEECIESVSQLDYIDYVCKYYSVEVTKTSQPS